MNFNMFPENRTPQLVHLFSEVMFKTIIKSQVEARVTVLKIKSLEVLQFENRF